MNNKNTQASLRQLKELVTSKDSRAPYADLTNAAYLMGDIEDGDIDYGDAEDGDADYGDADYGDADYGDVDSSALGSFKALIGDSETGAPHRRKMGIKGKRIVGATLGLGGGIGAGLLLNNILKKRSANRRRANSRLKHADSKMTIQNQVNARRLMGKLPRNAQMPFYQVTGAVLNAAPISPTESFVADALKGNFDRQMSDTPFEVEIVAGTFAGVTWTVNSVGVAASRYYTAVVITIGINQLAANPGTIFSITGSLPTINGGLTISSNPFSFTMQNGYYSTFLIFPWQIVTNKPLLALGSYNSGTPIVFNITGLPSNANVSMTIPGSQHVWTIGMRNRLL